MKSMKKIIGIFMLAAALFSCKKDKNNNNNTGNGSMTAKVAGASFNADLAVQATLSNSVLSFAGTGSNGQINITIPSYDGPGTFTIGGGSFTTAIYATTSTPIESYSASVVLGSGSVTVTSDDGGYVKGTFNFTGYSSGGAASKAITDGSFNIKLQ